MTDQKTVMVLFKGGAYGGLSSVTFTADTWHVADGRLHIRAAGQDVAVFPRGHWLGVLDDAHRQPDLSSGAMLAARRALANIARECANGRQASIQFIDKLARDGLMEAQAGEMTEP